MFAYMADEAQRRGNVVWFLVHRRELEDQTVATFERFNIEFNSIYIDMVNTVSRRLDNLHIPEPDLIIFDEAHFSAATTWQRIIDKFPNAYIVGLTATPTRLDGKPLGDIYDNLVLGESIGQLIDRGHLAPYKYYAPTLLETERLSSKRGEYDLKEAEKQMNERAIYGDVIKHYRQYADGKQTVVYCSTIEHSERVAEEFRSAGYNAMHFDGNTPKKERERIVQAYRDGDITILCNVDLISVGFDMPDIECAILLRPTQSTALYIQQASRALRKKEGKTAVILDHVGNYARHGLPDDDHEWTLEGKFLPPRPHDDEGMLTVRQCEQCYGVYKSELKQCPHCGHEYEITQREIEYKKEIELQEIKRKEKEVEAQRIEYLTEQVTSYDDVDECRTIEEINLFAKATGRKPGWAYYIAKSKGWLK